MEGGGGGSRASVCGLSTSRDGGGGCRCGCTFDTSSRRATKLTLANASPRNPKLESVSKSCVDVNLDVAKRVAASPKSSLAMPQPSSMTCNLWLFRS